MENNIQMNITDPARGRIIIVSDYVTVLANLRFTFLHQNHFQTSVSTNIPYLRHLVFNLKQFKLLEPSAIENLHLKCILTAIFFPTLVVFDIRNRWVSLFLNYNIIRVFFIVLIHVINFGHLQKLIL